VPYANTNGIQTYYREVGSGGPLLFIHGGLGGIASYVWGEIHDNLLSAGASYRLITYERRGCGRKTEFTDSGYDLKNFALDAKALLDHLGIDRAHVLGSSAGGPIATRFAIDFPERIDALVLANTSPRLIPDDDITRRIRELFSILEREGAEALYRSRPVDAQISIAQLWERPNAIELDMLDWYEQRYRELEKAARDVPREELVRRYSASIRLHVAYDGVDLTPELSRIKAPTLLVHGARDREVPIEGAFALFGGIPRAELHAFSDLEHGILYRDRRDQVRRVVFDFLSRVDGLMS
jgi:pimeloyl-ACP methyl ester carboxylesterase